MNVLVACEYSGTVRDAFRARGHNAMSCDLLPTDVPGPHHTGDVFEVLDDQARFFGGPVDLMVAHPPCTYLTRAGARWLFEDCATGTAAERWELMAEGVTFLWELLHADVPRVAVENPRPHAYAAAALGIAPTQVIHPWEYGHPEAKATCLWLRGLPPLLGVEDSRAVYAARPRSEGQRLFNLPPSADRWKLRSATFPGIAAAMADQWGQP